MKKRRSWLIALVVGALLVVACGPAMTTPTPGGAGPTSEATTTNVPPTEAVAGATSETATSVPATEAIPGTEVAGPPVPVDPNDWRTHGWADAPVTIVEYSDFQ
jgi:hypothetical protein